jgi:transcriptional regulator with XRE-family HTH domain
MDQAGAESTLAHENFPDYETIGLRVKARRLALGWSTHTLAEKAGIARYTVIRIEEGRPCKTDTLTKLRKALHLFSDQLTRPLPPSDKYAVHRASETSWTVAKSKDLYQKQLARDDPSHVNDEGERQRLGGLGFQPFFTAKLDSELAGGMISPGIMELHQQSWVDAHYGEEFVYCLRGRVRISVDGDDCELGPGDSMVFDAGRPHQYFPVAFDEDGRPPQILVVVAMREKDKQQMLQRKWDAQESSRAEPGLKK